MKVVSPWFLFFLFMAAAISTTLIAFLLSLTPIFIKAVVYAVIVTIALVGAAFALDDVICAACDVPQARYYGILFGFAGAVILGSIVALGVVGL